MIFQHSMLICITDYLDDSCCKNLIKSNYKQSSLYLHSQFIVTREIVNYLIKKNLVKFGFKIFDLI